MKLQHLAVIFVIIIIPISLVLSMYINNQIKTINYQSDYTSKLLDSTYDGIKAFQLNTANNSYSSIGNSKIRDIEAAINTFYASLATNFGSSGYTKEDLQHYTPALVFNLYDGYYIYSNNYNTQTDNYEYGLKPFIYYSCRYKSGSSFDFVVNYTLDNTITVIGTVRGNYVTKTGHLITTEDSISPEREILTENLTTLNNPGRDTTRTETSYQYIIYNNQKIYKENGINASTPDRQRFFYYTSAYSKEYINSLEDLSNLNAHLDSNFNFYSDSAIKYYEEAQEFTNWVKTNLGSITVANAVDNDGNAITNWASDLGNEKIFDISSNNNPLKSNSSFNEHRRNVIRKSIETNLISAIANYNNHSIIGYEFATPELGEEEWDKIENNISLTTFMQGLSIGGKIYNNYCVVSNDSNQETVGNNSIYIIDSTGTYHKPGCKTLVQAINSGSVTLQGAYSSSDFKRKTVSLTGADANAGSQLTGTDTDLYAFFYPQVSKTYSSSSTACYNCIVTASDTYSTDDIIADTVKDTNGSKVNISAVRKMYLTALARTRYDLYMTNGYFK